MESVSLRIGRGRVVRASCRAGLAEGGGMNWTALAELHTMEWSTQRAKL